MVPPQQLVPYTPTLDRSMSGEGMEVEELSQQMIDLTSPSKPPAPKKPKKGGDGGSSAQAIELTETQE